jgi:hypothetical protein
MGQQGLQIGSELGGRTANAGANVGQSLLRGGLSAAQTSQAANAYNPLANVLQGIGSNPYLAQGVGKGISNFGNYLQDSYNISQGNSFMAGSDYSV